MRFDFIVLGSGIAGLSTAYILAERGYSVALTGVPELLSMAGGSSSGILTYHMKQPFLEWSFKTLNFYTRLGGSVIERVPCIWMSRDSSFVNYVASKVIDHGIKLRPASKELLSSIGADIQVLDEEIITIGDGFRIMVGKLIDVMMEKLSKLGARIIRRWGFLEGSKVRVGGESLDGGAIIVAAGAWSGELLPLNNSIIYKCQAVRLEEPGVKYVIIDDTLNYYINLAQDGTTALGDGIKVVVEKPEEALKADKWVAEKVIERARRRGILTGYKISYIVSAPCIGTADTYPLLGEVRENVYVITALNGVGFSIAPALAEILVDSITRGASIPEELRSDRKIESVKPREPID